MENHLKTEFINAFKGKAIVDTEYGRMIHSDYDQYLAVIDIERLVHGIIKLKGDKSFVLNSKPHSRYTNHAVIACKDPDILYHLKKYTCPDFYKRINFIFPIHSFNPYIELFFRNVRAAKDKVMREREAVRAASQLPPFKYCDYGDRNSCRDQIELFSTNDFDSEEGLENRVKILNALIEAIQSEAESRRFKNIMRRYEKNLRQNTNSLTDYIDGLFERYARLLVMRVDFGYRKQNRYSITEKEIHEAYQQTKIDREHFFRNMRSNTLFDHLLGYVWKLEYGLDKGFHYHLIFFYDGSKVQQDINRARMIGEYWQTTITPGRGIYFNCNAKQEQYKYRGIGMVNYFDTELRANLIKAATYLTKSDYYATVIVMGEGRTFGKGQIKHNTSNRKGRPRKFADYLKKHRQHCQLTRAKRRFIVSSTDVGQHGVQTKSLGSI